MRYLSLFSTFLAQAAVLGVRFVLLCDLAAGLLKDPSSIPLCDLVPGTVGGRSGTLAVQRCS